MECLKYVSPLSCYEVIKEGKLGRFMCSVGTLCSDTLKRFHKRTFVCLVGFRGEGSIDVQQLELD